MCLEESFSFTCTSPQWPLSICQPRVLQFGGNFSLLLELLFLSWIFWTGPLGFIQSFNFHLCLFGLSRGVSKLYLPTLMLKKNFFKISVRFLIFKRSFVPQIFLFYSLVLFSCMLYFLIFEDAKVFSFCIVSSSFYFVCVGLTC